MGKNEAHRLPATMPALPTEIGHNSEETLGKGQLNMVSNTRATPFRSIANQEAIEMAYAKERWSTKMRRYVAHWSGKRTASSYLL